MEESGDLAMNPYQMPAPIQEIFALGVDEEDGAHIDVLLTTSEAENIKFSVDRRGVSHKNSGPEGGRFVTKGEEGPEAVSKERQKKRSFAKKRGEVTEKVKGIAKDAAKKVGKKSLEGAKTIGGKVSAAEHFASNWIGEKVEALPAAIRLPLKALYYAGFGAFLAGQKMAKAVATEVGGVDYGNQIGTVLAVIDNTAAVSAKIAGLAGAHGPTAIPLLLPVASATYLAYSTVRHPVATVTAAGKGVKAALQKMKSNKVQDKPEQQPDIPSSPLGDTLKDRTLEADGVFYHVTNGENANSILKSGFDTSKVGTGLGLHRLQLGEPLGISFFPQEEHARSSLNTEFGQRGEGKSIGDTLLGAKLSRAKVLDARGLKKGPWQVGDEDGEWAQFVGHLFNIEGEEVFDRRFVTKLLLDHGYDAVLQERELRVLNPKVISHTKKI